MTRISCFVTTMKFQITACIADLFNGCSAVKDASVKQVTLSKFLHCDSEKNWTLFYLNMTGIYCPILIIIIIIIIIKERFNVAFSK